MDNNDRVFYEGQFAGDRTEITSWVKDLAASRPGIKRIMAGPGVKKGSGKLKGAPVLFDHGIDENIVATITGAGIKVAALSQDEKYPFHQALHESGIVGADARAIAPGLEKVWTKQ